MSYLNETKMQQQPIKLHLGCFKKKIHGFINVDIRGDVEPDVVDDVSKLERFKPDSVDLIYTSHVLEHFTREDSIKAMKRWHEVIKPNGTIRISVPDLEACFEHYICHKKLDLLKCLLYGSQKHPYDFHYTGWDFTTLKRDLESVGFKDVRRYDWTKTEHFFVDDYSAAYLPHKDQNGKLMSLNVEATK